MTSTPSPLARNLAAARVRPPTVVTIGTFDGVHLGHQRLIGETAERAAGLAATAVALTFQPRPAEVLRPEVPSRYLTTLEGRQRLLLEAGAAAVVVLPFTPELATTSAEDFVIALVQVLGMRELIGGPDLTLGRGRQGTPEVLRTLGERLGFRVRLVPALEIEGEAVRSSNIQRILSEGDVAHVTRLLGRPHAVEGTVVHGEGRGRTIGVPTANLRIPPEMALPANGVYAVRARVNEREVIGAANLGTRPTFEGVGRSLEVHLLDFSEDIYGATVSVAFLARLRPERRFSSVEELVQQIHADIRQARDIS